MGIPERRAVLDVGSNSVLLLVAERDGDHWRPIYEATQVTGLGRDTKVTGLLQPDAMEDTLAALRTFFDAAREHKATRILAGGTMALRIAHNAAEFQDRATAQGTPVEIVSGDQEAELGFHAVADDPAFADHSRISIVDPGGQSTELVTADRNPEGAWEIRFRKSYSVGALGLRETLLKAESPEPPARLAASAFIDDLIGMAYRPNQAGHVVTLGATGTNLISIREKLLTWQPEKVHGAWLDYEEIGRAVGWMFDMSDAGRAAIPGIEPGREKTLHIGCLILERFLQSLHVLGCSVSVRGWRHALLERM
ncbi:MAG: hypothetical protein JST40_02505 [Armatimonadetes bacterium]|nr:hypothetical protein [Armatimonadota bacterium]